MTKRRLIVGRFGHKSLHRLQKLFLANEDLHGRNVQPLNLLLPLLHEREVLKYIERKFATVA